MLKWDLTNNPWNQNQFFSKIIDTDQLYLQVHVTNYNFSITRKSSATHRLVYHCFLNPSSITSKKKINPMKSSKLTNVHTVQCNNWIHPVYDSYQTQCRKIGLDLSTFHLLLALPPDHKSCIVFINLLIKYSELIRKKIKFSRNDLPIIAWNKIKRTL